jgi:hypothetical protein
MRDAWLPLLLAASSCATGPSKVRSPESATTEWRRKLPVSETIPLDVFRTTPNCGGDAAFSSPRFREVPPGHHEVPGVSCGPLRLTTSWDVEKVFLECMARVRDEWTYSVQVVALLRSRDGRTCHFLGGGGTDGMGDEPPPAQRSQP